VVCSSAAASLLQFATWASLLCTSVMCSHAPDCPSQLAPRCSGMDAMARGLRNAAKLVQEGLLDGMRRERYSSWADSQLGRCSLDASFCTGEHWQAAKACRRPCQRPSLLLPACSCLPVRCPLHRGPASTRCICLQRPVMSLPHHTTPLSFRRDITAGKVGFEELEKAVLGQPDPWDAGLPSGQAELSEIVLSRYVR